MNKDIIWNSVFAEVDGVAVSMNRKGGEWYLSISGPRTEGNVNITAIIASCLQDQLKEIEDKLYDAHDTCIHQECCVGKTAIVLSSLLTSNTEEK